MSLAWILLIKTMLLFSVAAHPFRKAEIKKNDERVSVFVPVHVNHQHGIVVESGSMSYVIAR
jgi:hypothetical protein